MIQICDGFRARPGCRTATGDRHTGRPAKAALWALLALVAGCSSTTRVADVEYAPKTTLALASSARCQGDSCSCRPLDSDDDQGEKGVPAGQKRFELRLPRSTSAIWVNVEGRGVYYKQPERVDPACFYVDLPPGKHVVTLHAEKRDPQVGLQAGLTVYEHAVTERNEHVWYRSADFVCGQGASRCTRGELTRWAAFQRKLPRGVLDPCGSVMIRGARFGGTRARRGDADYEELTLYFTMKVYDFKPYRRPGSPKCKAPIKNR